MNATARLERKVVQLSRSASPRDFLVLDWTGSGGDVRVVHYFIRPPKPVQGWDGAAPTPQQLDAGKTAGWFNHGAKREAWVRVAVARETLADALYVCLQGTAHEWRTVEAYVRATGWGETLP